MNIIYGSLVAENSATRFDGLYVRKPLQQPGLLRYLPQFNFLPPKLKIRTIFKHYGLSFQDCANFFPDLKTKENERAGYLSDGQIRLIEAYLVLRSPARFVMLDEPFSHIMPLHAETLQSLIMEEKMHKGILVSDHLYKYVEAIADTLYVLKDGKLHVAKDVADLRRLGYIPER